ncbi:acyl-CoA thioesterase [Neisseria montereyensis]|uniref:Acyl-CoA thioesterase n=1 Tax=Neisseria montereyensis TaxID=2973938 RepID=A0ABT2FED0_9NEIS|nr:thioesterase family protein [Neisseria montereyensis]MCS4534553.1 acyl-CoA thioesterase [Neisseria montereyensis]
MTEIRVRSYHIDGYGHVNNARYLEFLEEARWAFFEQHDLLNHLTGLMMVVSRIDIRYKRAAQENQILRIDTHIRSVERREVVLTQTISRSDTGKTMAEADITLVPVSSESGRTTDLPPELYHFLNQYRSS